jgi:hypothetical protein
MDLETLTSTRRALHGIAEAVLAGPQWRTSKDIRLRATPGGFGTVTLPDLRIDGDLLVAGELRVPIAGQTCAKLAAAAGVEASVLQHEVYAEGPDVDLEDTITVDAAAARHLARCFALGDAALRRLAPDVGPVLWPEHFDIGSTVDEVNYGVSPGDAWLAEPYAYVGPWQVPTGLFWNAPFGAATPMSQLPDPDAVLAFFHRGRAEAGRKELS